MRAIENQKVDINHRPYAHVRIHNCGELVLMKVTVDSECVWVCVCGGGLHNVEIYIFMLGNVYANAPCVCVSVGACMIRFNILCT